MDSLFSKIFDLFANQRIFSNEIDKAKDTKEILNKIKKKEPFKKISNKLKASKLILYYSYQDYFFWLIKDMRRNELIKEINSLYKGDIDDIDELREKLKSEVDELEDKNKIIKEYLKSISEFENIFQNDGYYLFSSNYNENAF